MDDRRLPLPHHVAGGEEEEVVLEEVITAPDEPGPMGRRREARETALVLLYEADARGQSPREVLDAQIVPPPEYAAALVSGVDDHRVEIDAILGEYARGWSVERMPAIDRALLRIGVFELAHRPDVPTGVILSEAVDLAGRYSTEDSSRFVNGVLARVAETSRPG